MDWYHGFIRHRKKLSLRVPLNCSLGRTSNFNQTKVNNFFDNLEKIMQRQPDISNGTRIYNLDETSVLTVPNHSPKIVTPKGGKK